MSQNVRQNHHAQGTQDLPILGVELVFAVGLVTVFLNHLVWWVYSHKNHKAVAGVLRRRRLVGSLVWRR